MLGSIFQLLLLNHVSDAEAKALKDVFEVDHQNDCALLRELRQGRVNRFLLYQCCKLLGSSHPMCWKKQEADALEKCVWSMTQPRVPPGNHSLATGGYLVGYRDRREVTLISSHRHWLHFSFRKISSKVWALSPHGSEIPEFVQVPPNTTAAVTVTVSQKSALSLVHVEDMRLLLHYIPSEDHLTLLGRCFFFENAPVVPTKGGIKSAETFQVLEGEPRRRVKALLTNSRLTVFIPHVEPGTYRVGACIQSIYGNATVEVFWTESPQGTSWPRDEMPGNERINSVFEVGLNQEDLACSLPLRRIEGGYQLLFNRRLRLFNEALTINHQAPLTIVIVGKSDPSSLPVFDFLALMPNQLVPLARPVKPPSPLYRGLLLNGNILDGILAHCGCKEISRFSKLNKMLRRKINTNEYKANLFKAWINQTCPRGMMAFKQESRELESPTRFRMKDRDDDEVLHYRLLPGHYQLVAHMSWPVAEEKELDLQLFTHGPEKEDELSIYWRPTMSGHQAPMSNPRQYLLTSTDTLTFTRVQYLSILLDAETEFGFNRLSLMIQDKPLIGIPRLMGGYWTRKHPLCPQMPPIVRGGVRPLLSDVVWKARSWHRSVPQRLELSITIALQVEPGMYRATLTFVTDMWSQLRITMDVSVVVRSCRPFANWNLRTKRGFGRSVSISKFEETSDGFARGDDFQLRTSRPVFVPDGGELRLHLAYTTYDIWPLKTVVLEPWGTYFAHDELPWRRIERLAR
eukprot:Blabericola_migrator_1__511@NODE_1123_length_5365_cov_358_819555_g765_i0_p1_GENE_NODE_1123_length_5365_cov_358_819555_g765_i0NODE_1123_length_5365_cov_358_819555_g765_i0_p1_ORF_typecomplete_len743_score60_42_NODE_1123_length_5365_cov_358_819555_g765_i012663494